MTNSKSIIVSTFTGILICSAWWMFIDGVITAPDRFPAAHIIPGFLAMMALVAINMVSPNQIESSGAVKFWLFIWITISMVSVGLAIWITSVEYPASVDYNWPGISIIMQTMFLLTAAMTLFVGRFNNESILTY